MKRVTAEAFRKKQWTRWLRTLDFGPNVAVFRTARDMASAKSIATRFRNSDETYLFTVIIDAETKTGTFIKIPKDDGARKMTRGDAVRLMALRMMPSASITDEYINTFSTAPARDKAKAIRRMRLFERVAERLFSTDNIRRQYNRRTDDDKDDDSAGRDD